jgi:hypothetical protein
MLFLAIFKFLEIYLFVQFFMLIDTCMSNVHVLGFGEPKDTEVVQG